MPILAAKYKCDGPCGKTIKDENPIAVLQGGTIMCEKCAALTRYTNRVYLWISPTEIVTRTKTIKKLTEDEYQEAEPC